MADLSALLAQLYREWRDHRDPLVITPRELYDRYVKPSYVLFREVHADYEDLYLELSERISREDTISDVTVEWFARARTRRAFDRSELAVIELPDVTAREDRAQDINALAIAYVAAIHDYFRPADRSRETWRRRMGSLDDSSASRGTEAKLRYLHVCSRLLPEDRRALAAEEEAENVAHTSRADDDETIAQVLTAVKGELTTTLSQHLQTMEQQSAQAGELLSKEERRALLWVGGEYTLKRFRWRRILLDHISAQRDALAQGMSDVQTSHVRLRILADR